MFIQTEDTPNPSTIKFLPGKEVMSSGTADFTSFESTEKSPLARRLIEIDGVAGVFLGSDFISITKANNFEWFSLKPSVLGKIMEHYASGEEALIINKEESSDSGENDSEIVQQIKLMESFKCLVI